MDIESINPINTLVRDQQTVILIGMTHIAPAASFQRVKSLLNDYEQIGCKVLYEDIIGYDVRLREMIGDPYEPVLKLRKMCHAFLKNNFDWDVQHDALPIQPQWIYADDLAPLATKLKETAHSHGDNWAPIIAGRMGNYLDIFRDPEGWMEKVLQGPPDNAIIRRQPFFKEKITLRDNHVVETALSLTTSDCLVLPGRSHLPGIKSLFERAGYQSVD